MVQSLLMWHHVLDLNAFYGTRLGQLARHLIRRRIRELWRDVSGRRVLGMGYAIPYLRPFATEAERLLVLMPAQQGAVPWPHEGENLVALTEEADIPLPDNSMDLALLVHAIECSEHLRAMLREVWRVLVGGGRILIVAPNRRGVWSWMERTPFGNGHPYSQGQLARLLRECLFAPGRTLNALYLPPTSSRVMLRAANGWERLGQRWGRPFGGVVLVEAEKEVYAGSPVGTGRRRTLVYPGLVGGSRTATRIRQSGRSQLNKKTA